MFSPEILSETVQSHKSPSPSGVSCRFIKLNDEWGIKAYKYQDERDRAARRQAEMSVHGYAPIAGLVFDAGNEYCYVTEVATPFKEQFPEESFDDYMTRFHKNNLRGFDNKDDADKCSELVDGMKKAGHIMSDFHAGNFGKLRDKVVCIDFGD